MSNDLNVDTLLDEVFSDLELAAYAEKRELEAIEQTDNNQNVGIDKMHLVFVYGSLKKGFSNHPVIENSKFLGNTETVDRNFRMFSLNYFPTVAETEGEDFTIIGELYDVDTKTLQDLDRLEGNGHLYNRKKVKVYWGLDIVEAWMYLRMPDDIICPVRHTSRFVYTNYGLNTQEWCQE